VAYFLGNPVYDNQASVYVVIVHSGIAYHCCHLFCLLFDYYCCCCCCCSIYSVVLYTPYLNVDKYFHFTKRHVQRRSDDGEREYDMAQAWDGSGGLESEATATDSVTRCASHRSWRATSPTVSSIYTRCLPPPPTTTTTPSDRQCKSAIASSSWYHLSPDDGCRTARWRRRRAQPICTMNRDRCLRSCT